VEGKGDFRVQKTLGAEEEVLGTLLLKRSRKKEPFHASSPNWTLHYSALPSFYLRASSQSVSRASTRPSWTL